MTRTVAVLLCGAALAYLASRPVPAEEKKPEEKVNVQKDVYPLLTEELLFA